MADTSFPSFLDPLLDYLYEILPSPIYSICEVLLSQTIRLFSAIITLGATLINSSPNAWDAEKILPPIITLLVSYLALLSFYRTTGWMIRTAFAFVKWGFLLSALGAAAGYILANGQNNGGNGLGALIGGGAGLIPLLGGYVLDLLNGQDQNVADGARTTGGRSTKSRTKNSRTRQARPKAYESWDKHKDWQYNENAANGAGSNPDVQKVINDVLGATGKAVKESKWWEVAKGVADEFKRGLNGEEIQSGETRSQRKAKSKSKDKVSSRSR
ncbi:hypothetical protein ABKN59_005302 [Abortiporus biennis]